MLTAPELDFSHVSESPIGFVEEVAVEICASVTNVKSSTRLADSNSNRDVNTFFEKPASISNAIDTSNVIVTFNSADKLNPRIVVLRRNEQNAFGFSILGGVENDSLPTIELRPDMKLNMFDLSSIIMTQSS